MKKYLNSKNVESILVVLKYFNITIHLTKCFLSRICYLNTNSFKMLCNTGYNTRPVLQNHAAVRFNAFKIIGRKTMTRIQNIERTCDV